MKRAKTSKSKASKTATRKPAKKKAQASARPAAAEPSTPDGLLAMEEAIEMLKTTRPTFYRWLRSGKLKGMKVGRQWRFYREEIERFLKGEAPQIELPADIRPLIETLARLAGSDAPAIGEGEMPNPPMRAVTWMVKLGVQLEASDFHITSHQSGGQTHVVLRYRINGFLQEVCEINPKLLPAIAEQFKRIAGCNTHEKQLPQDGRVRMRVLEKTFDLQCAFLPDVLGESITVRFMDPGALRRLKLDTLLYSAHDQERIRRALQKPWGMIVCTGPMGSGKTTTLYACVSHLASPEKKVMSVEDPVEYLLPWVTQVAVRADAGLTFDRALRSILKSAPNTIMVGEMRDQETLKLCLHAAVTGHVVLTGMHTNNAVSALRRMVQVGAYPSRVTDATCLIVAQRLVRKLCPHCSVQAPLTPGQLQTASALMHEGGATLDGVEHKFRKTIGCDKCAHTGYHGRTVIAETLEITPDLSEALQADASLEELQAIAVRNGMQTMAVDGVRRAAAGETTLDEVRRVVPFGQEM